VKGQGNRHDVLVAGALVPRGSWENPPMDCLQLLSGVGYIPFSFAGSLQHNGIRPAAAFCPSRAGGNPSALELSCAPAPDQVEGRHCAGVTRGVGYVLLSFAMFVQ
jgi:hypothetical protein